MDNYPPKRAGERLSYTVEVDDWLAVGAQIVSASVEIVGSSNAESPVALTFFESPNVTISSSGQTSPALNDRMTITLLGGTPGVTYYLKFSFTDNVADPTANQGERFIAIDVVDFAPGLVVAETGSSWLTSPVLNVNSFGTLAEADAYFAARNDTVWLYADTWNRESALVKACDYMEQRYRMLWAGARVSIAQKRSWPRRGVPLPDFFDPFFRNTSVPFDFRNTHFIEENVVPDLVKEAQFILARATLDDDGLSNVALQETLDRPIKRQKLEGGGEIEYFGGEGQQARETKIYWEADNLLAPFLRSDLVGESVRG